MSKWRRFRAAPPINQTMIHGTLTQITPPSGLIVSLADLKLHLRVENSTEDGLIQTYAEIAQEALEIDLGRSLLPQAWKLYFDCFPEKIYLRRPPVTSLTEIKYYDTDGVLTVLTSDEYQFSQIDRRPFIVPAIDTTFPETQDGKINAVYVQYAAGYADAASVPKGIKQALRLIVGSWYENREETITGVTQMVLPRHIGLESLLAKYRMVA